MHKLNKKIMCSFLALMALNASNATLHSVYSDSSDGPGSPSVSIRSSSICPSRVSALRVDNNNLDDLHLCFPSGESSDADSNPSSKDKSNPKASMQPEFTNPTASSSSGNPTTNIASFKLNPEAAEFIPQAYKFSNEQLPDSKKKKEELELAIKRIENCLSENEENETAKRIKDEILKRIENYLNRIESCLRKHGISKNKMRSLKEAFKLAKEAAIYRKGGNIKKLRSLLNRPEILKLNNQNYDEVITDLINQLEKVLDEINIDNKSMNSEGNPNAQMSSNPEPRPKLTPMSIFDSHRRLKPSLNDSHRTLRALNLEPGLNSLGLSYPLEHICADAAKSDVRA